MIRGLEQAAQNLNLEVPQKQASSKQPVLDDSVSERIPMMYRAQIKGRCNLHFIGQTNNLERWTEEWINPDKNRLPRYQHSHPPSGWDGNVYRIKIEFPWRIFSDCGQDSIARPIIGKYGIPFFPGSSIKGLFRRACTAEQVQVYCGNEQSLDPSDLGFRFLGAYPVGDWSQRINDVVHPQQSRQVEHQNKGSAYAVISLYRPQMVFEFSALHHLRVDWDEVNQILQAALELGFGGKTSTGYGMNGHTPGQSPSYPQASYMMRFTGVGIKSTLRTEEFEFRPNLFKASLRTHARRLLGGVCDNTRAVETKVCDFFGGTSGPGKVQLLWQEQSNSSNHISHYNVTGILRIYGPQDESLLVYQILQFAYVMGGFGKSWRRVWHRTFYPSYKKFDIGCHWQSPDIISTVRSSENLQDFLNRLHQSCRNLMQSSGRATQWKESWHPNRVAVFSCLTDKSKVISLFHDDAFKTTPAIGGKKIKDKRPTSVSFIWHRMLPVSETQYLEIVTVFHRDIRSWQRNQQNQLPPFIEALEHSGLSLTWGQHPLIS